MSKMNKHILSFIIFSFLIITFSSCSKKKVEIPPNVLGREAMIPILADVHIAQAATGNYKAADAVHYNMNEYLPYILRIHHISQAQYDTSLSFYMRHPEIMKDLYDDVIVELSKKQGEISAH